MAKPFIELRERLLRAGVAPRHVRRYVAELTDHLADLTAEEERAGRIRADAESAALVRLGGIDGLCRAMIGQRRFQSWSARAPWAMFGFAPLLLLATAYFVACLILWSGWKIFLPGNDTPFVRIGGPAILYFGVGKWLYFGAPVVVGWGIALVAARQRFNAIWPAASLVLVALIGAMAEVHTSRPASPGGAGNVSMNFTLGDSVQSFSNSLFHSLAILALTALPYLVWRLQKSRSVAA